MPGKFKTKEMVQADLDRLFGSKIYTITGEYAGTSQYTEFRHHCGNVFITTPFCLKTGGKKCVCEKQTTEYQRGYFNGSIKSTQQVQQELNQHFGCQEYMFLDAYKGNDGYSIFKHTCGQQVRAKARTLKSGTTKCPCLHERQYHRTVESHNLELVTWGKQDYICLEYSGSRLGLNTYQHKTCGKTFQRNLYHFKMLTFCPMCPNSYQKIVTHKGQDYYVQGYEDRTLKVLLRFYTIDQIYTAKSGKIPRFEYKYSNRRSTYRPDFYIPHTNTIVEVKSLLTMGLRFKRDKCFIDSHLLYKRNQAKARAVIKRGFKFEMHLYIRSMDKYPAKLPEEWFLMSKRDLMESLNKDNLEYIRPLFCFKFSKTP